MPRSRTSLLVLLLLTCGLAASSAENRLNLSQARQMVRLGEAARTDLQARFGHPVAAGELPAPLRNSILQTMPEDFRNECRSLMGAWAGDRGRNSSIWSVRLLDMGSKREWLAFHCGSSLQEEDMERYADERLALLRLDSGTIELLPPGPRDEENEGVLHYAFARHISLKNATGFCFRLIVGNNPCCDGPEYRSQERLVIFVETPHGVVESLSVLTGRDDSSHSDDPEVDTETTYQSDVTFEHDAKNLVTAARAAFREKVVETTWEASKANSHTVSEHSGTLQYQWNPLSLKFDAVR